MSMARAMDGYTAQITRALGICLDAVALDLESAGIPADMTKAIALHYKQTAIELGATSQDVGTP